MHVLLEKANIAVLEAGGKLSAKKAKKWRKKYLHILDEANIECPEPERPKGVPKRGRVKRSKSRNLLERLRDYEKDVLRFMENKEVPFINNQGERDIRMTKVQQKISGCFRSKDGAEMFCLIHSYLSTYKKHQVGVGEALECLFRGEWPEFIHQKMEQMV
jgi:transposase